jgi:hypothetical protein
MVVEKLRCFLKGKNSAQSWNFDLYVHHLFEQASKFCVRHFVLFGHVLSFYEEVLMASSSSYVL